MPLVKIQIQCVSKLRKSIYYSKWMEYMRQINGIFFAGKKNALFMDFTKCICYHEKDSVTVCTDYFCPKKAADNRKRGTVNVLNRYEKAI